MALKLWKLDSASQNRFHPPVSRCEPKYFRAGDQCRSCEGQTQAGAAAVVGLVVLPAVGLVAAPTEGNHGALWVWLKISWQSLRIVISLFQVLSALGDALHIAFGAQLRALVELAVFDAASLLRLECIGVQHDFYRLWWLRAGCCHLQPTGLVSSEGYFLRGLFAFTTRHKALSGRWGWEAFTLPCAS